MGKFVLMILGMSVEAMIVLAAVLVLRLVFRRLPRSYACALWFLVLFRLLCPVAISSSVSLMPGRSIWQDGARASAGIEEAAGAEQPGNRTIEEWKALQEQSAQGRTGTGTAPGEASGNASLTVQDVPGGQQAFSESVNRLAGQVSTGFLSFWEEWGIWLSIVWLAGAVGLTVAYAMQYVNWKERVRGCTRVPLRETADNGVRLDGQDIGGHGRMRGLARFLPSCRIRLAESARIDEPYVCGLLRPVIYLPAGMEEKERSYVLCHEKIHIRHFDPFIRLLWQAALVLHWFNPLVWLAVSLVQKDMEMFCDESVLRQCGNGARKDYALALLHFSVKKSGLPFPVAFGESDTESRIRHILKNRKPTIAIGALAVLAIICAAVFLLTDPKENDVSEEGLRALAEEALADGQEVLLFDYADYDGDGTEEAFAYAGTTEDGEIAAGGAGGVSENRGEKILDTASAWATAFVNRDGSAIEAVSAGADAMEAMGFEKAGDVYLVGQSSPWPWLEDFQINYSLTEDEAVIFYYARTSDPKVSTWKQTLQLEEKDGVYVVSGCKTDMETIASAAAFRERYHYEDQQEYAIGNIGYRFKNTPMDLLSKTEDGEMKPELAVLLTQSSQPRTPEDTAAWWLDLDGGSAVMVDSPWEDKVCLRWRFSDGETDVIVLAHPVDEKGNAFSLWLVEDILEEDEWQIRRLKVRLADFYMEEASRLAESGLEYEDGLISAMADGKDAAVLLARSGAVELYGLVSEGSAQGVFIREGNDSQYFDWYYTDSHAICPELEQGDFDGDGQDELAVILRNGHGTEFSVEGLILLEKEQGRWEQREYPYSAYETQLQEEVACGYDRETGQLTFSDVKKDVILGEENIAELMGGDAQFAAVTFGNMLSYTVQDDGIYMKLQPRIEVEGEAIGRYGSLVLQARVRYDGDSFWLEEYEMVRE